MRIVATSLNPGAEQFADNVDAGGYYICIPSDPPEVPQNARFVVSGYISTA